MGARKLRIHRPGLLDDEESWLLFCKFAFITTRGKCNAQLEKVGKEIVRKCHGIPLAIKTTGNHEIEAEQLVRWWVGEGLAYGDDTETATNVAYNYLSELVSRCLVKAIQRRNFDGKVYSCKMYDMVRDMKILVTEDEKFCSFKRGRPIATSNSRHLGVNKDTAFQPLARNSKLRVLFLTKTKSIGFNRKIALAEIKTLRVLDLSCVKLDNICLHNLWLWITSLKRLAYLNLRDVANLEEIPNSVRNLWGLQILVLRECKELKRLPTSITTLSRLAILDVRGCPSFSCLPQGLSRLSNLEELYGFEIPSPATMEACRLNQVMALTQLQYCN
ncbi:putative xyloglucan endotransglucosylase/hydrolase protein 9-like [Capsicum annuum]|nr:putative xyloglucan endotransglucosylase/hydrolase protein 9-like [Capsicum annuum]